jgi:hypothetical protein
MTQRTQDIIKEIFNDSDMYASIVCLGLINVVSQRTSVGVHGYYITGSIELLFIVARILNNRDIYDKLYGELDITNLINEIMTRFYYGINQNLDSLSLVKSTKVTLKNMSNVRSNSINYTQHVLSMMTQQYTFEQNKDKYENRTNRTNTTNTNVRPCKRMKKTDIFCTEFLNKKLEHYSKLRRMDDNDTIQNINMTYGSVCCLAISLGWLVSMEPLKDNKGIIKQMQVDKSVKVKAQLDNLEKMGNALGVILKIYEDFKTFKKDLIFYSNMNIHNGNTVCKNYVLTHGAKNAYILMMDSIEMFEKQCYLLDIKIRPFPDIKKIIEDEIETITQDMSIGMDDDIDDMSSLYSTAFTNVNTNVNTTNTTNTIDTTNDHNEN